MKKLLLIAVYMVFCFGATKVSAQKLFKSYRKGKVYDVVDQEPVYPGGNAQITRVLMDHLSAPAERFEEVKNGKLILIKFIVEEDGTISSPQVLDSPSSEFEAAVFEALMALELFEPAELNGEKVRFHFYIPLAQNQEVE